MLITWGGVNNARRKELVVGEKRDRGGGSGVADKFWEWSEEQVKPYL